MKLLHSFDQGFNYVSEMTSTILHHVHLAPEEKSVGHADYRLRYEKLVKVDLEMEELLKSGLMEESESL